MAVEGRHFHLLYGGGGATLYGGTSIYCMGRHFYLLYGGGGVTLPSALWGWRGYTFICFMMTHIHLLYGATLVSTVWGWRGDTLRISTDLMRTERGSFVLHE